MRQKIVFMCLGCLLAAGCVPFWKPRARPPVTTFANGMPIHRSWCYETLGKVDCYTSPQDFPEDRLVSVYPPSQHPLTAEEYAKDIAESR